MKLANSPNTKVHNGKALLIDQVDGRRRHAKRYKEIHSGLTAQVGENLTEGQKSFIKRAAGLSLWCEIKESELTEGGDFNVGEFLTATNALRRLMADLGLAHDSEPRELVAAKHVIKAVKSEMKGQAA